MLLAVDVCEGVMLATERAIQQAVQEGLPICLLLTKVGKGAGSWEQVRVWESLGACVAGGIRCCLCASSEQAVQEGLPICCSRR